MKCVQIVNNVISPVTRRHWFSQKTWKNFFFTFFVLFSVPFCRRVRRSSIIKIYKINDFGSFRTVSNTPLGWNGEIEIIWSIFFQKHVFFGQKHAFSDTATIIRSFLVFLVFLRIFMYFYVFFVNQYIFHCGVYFYFCNYFSKITIFLKIQFPLLGKSFSYYKFVKNLKNVKITLSSNGGNTKKTKNCEIPILKRGQHFQGF